MIETVGRTRSSATTSGVGFVLLANALWAAQPLFWPLVDESGIVELIAHRVCWSAAFCVVAVVLIGPRQTGLRSLGARPRQVSLLAAAGVCLAAAWGVYVYAVNSGQVVEASLGMFMIPLCTVLAGALAFGERLRLTQWVAVGGTCAGTMVLTLSYGRPPWIALTLSSLMTLYAVLKKRAAAPVLAGLTVECLAVVPPAACVIGWLAATGTSTFGQTSFGHTALVAASGLITAVPLLAYAAGIARLPLTTIGILQYLNPTAQFLLGVFVRAEHMSSAHWIGFTILWLAVGIFMTDSARRGAGTASVNEDRHPSCVNDGDGQDTTPPFRR